SVPNSRLQLLPPKPNELDSTRSSGRSCGATATRLLSAGSRLATLRLPGMKPSRTQSREMTASTMPAAPSVCPVQPLVELQATVSPNRPNTAAASAPAVAEQAEHGGVLVPVVRRRAGAMQVDVADLRRPGAGALERLAHRGRRAR